MAIVVTGATGHVGRPLVMQLHAAGATRLVALSAINADDEFSRQPSRVLGDRNKEVEQLAMESGLEWTSLRPTVFATTYVGGAWAAQIRAGDVVRGPYAQASNSPIVESDVAAVATRAFLGDDLVGHRIPLTGPEAFTNAELVKVIGEVLGRPLRYEEVPPEIVRKTFIAAGVSAQFADAYIAFMQGTVEQPVRATPNVERLLGRSARSIAEWVADHRELFTA